MPAPAQDVLVPPTTAPITVDLAPAHNAIHSLLLLLKVDHVSGLDEWIIETAAGMSDEEMKRHRLVMEGFYYAIQPDGFWPSFPAYLEHLASRPPVQLRDKVLDAYAHIQSGERKGNNGSPSWASREEILSSLDNYLDCLRECFGPEDFDDALEAEAYGYLVDPPALQALLVFHLRRMWENYLADEWAQVSPMLRDAVDAFRQVDLGGMSRSEAVEFIADRKLPDGRAQEKLDAAERLVFVPSAHVGPYLSFFKHNGVLGILFRARLPQGTRLDAPDLSRADLVVRLNALADDTRLRILKLIAQEGELRSPDIMERVDLSQSAASRHLKQLSATGYLSERRCDGAKCYQLNADRVQDTLRAVSAFLIG